MEEFLPFIALLGQTKKGGRLHLPMNPERICNASGDALHPTSKKGLDIYRMLVNSREGQKQQSIRLKDRGTI